MVIESFEIKAGTIKQLPVGTEILSVSLKKKCEIGKPDEDLIFITVGLKNDRISEIENREFFLASAEKPLVVEDCVYHSTISLCNMTQPVYVLSRVV